MNYVQKFQDDMVLRNRNKFMTFCPWMLVERYASASLTGYTLCCQQPRNESCLYQSWNVWDVVTECPLCCCCVKQLVIQACQYKVMTNCSFIIMELDVFSLDCCHVATRGQHIHSYTEKQSFKLLVHGLLLYLPFCLGECSQYYLFLTIHFVEEIWV